MDENDDPPDGFVNVKVTLTRAEYDRLGLESLLTDSGTRAAALRRMARLPEQPYGLRTALRRRASERGDGA